MKPNLTPIPQSTEFNRHCRIRGRSHLRQRSRQNVSCSGIQKTGRVREDAGGRIGEDGRHIT